MHVCNRIGVCVCECDRMVEFMRVCMCKRERERERERAIVSQTNKTQNSCNDDDASAA